MMMGAIYGHRMTVTLFLVLLLASSARSFYLPGVAPRDFQTGNSLPVKVNKLSSTKTQLPYDYYFLNYCKPKKILNNAENLGEVLRGDRIENSVYTFQMRKDQSCTVACRRKLDAASAKNFKEKIKDEYRVNMILDNLPVAVLRQRRDGLPSTTYEHGFRVGFKGSYSGSKAEKYFINNHLSFRVMYHKDPETDSSRIVGFEVTPNSISHEYKDWDDKNPQLATCNKDTKISMQGNTVPQEVDTDKDIVFTYDVTFKESEIKWASRWDTYLLMNDDQIHWFSIINSLMIVLFLSGMVAMIMMRTLYRDIANYNQLETQDEAQEETGWKLVHGDVFRPPINFGLLCVYVGTGVQIFAMTLVTMIFALLGFLSPSNRGGLMTAMVLLWVFMGLFAGYSSARLYKMFKGTEWKRNTLKTAFMFPGILFGVFFVLNALIWGEQSSGAVPFGTMFALVCLWFGISVPLVFVGSYLGFKKPAIEDPVKTNKIPRQIPEQAWYMKPVFSILIGGILPFGAVFIELFFILTSIWLNQFYYIFGFLFIVFVILLITCVEITVVLCYFQLCSEDYYWWWRSYLTAGSSALYLFIYSVFYFLRVLRELSAVQRKIVDLQVELQGRKDDKNVAHLTHVTEMEKKTETLARITTILKDVIQNKDRIIARLQQPYSLDCIPVEAEYQKQFSELLMKAAGDYGALTTSVADFQWSQNFKEPPSVWGEMLRPIPVALASCTRFFEAMSAMRDSFATLQNLRVGHFNSSLPATPVKNSSQRVGGDSNCVTPPPWRNGPSFDDLVTRSLSRQKMQRQEAGDENGEISDLNQVDGTSHRRLSWPPSVKTSGI